MKFALFLAVAFVFAVVACGDDDDPPTAITPGATQESSDEDLGQGSATEPPTQESSTSAEPPAVQLVPAFLVNRFSNRVLDLDPIPGEDGRYLALFQDGIIVLLDESAPEDGVLVVDLQDRVNDEGLEEGLLGLAFDPDWEGQGSVYVYYTAADPRRGVLSRLTFDGQSISPESEQVLFEVDQPFPNHNGGALVFGPDGYLYLGLGDGGGRGDPTGNGQNGNHLGSILRFDVSGEEIAVPEDNPFADGNQGFAPETYAYGFRNPWRFSFDRETDTFWVADVGERAFEEIDIVEAGANYGWSIMEGPECFQPPEGCDQSGLVLPVTAYGHDEGCSITGGYVYRGQEIAGLTGWYMYSDFCSGRIWALSSEDPSRVVVMLDSRLPVSSFAEDSAGELFVLAFDGIIYRVAAA